MVTKKKKAQKRLSKAHKLMVVFWLACFKTPSEVEKLVKEHCGVATTRQAIERYDPTKVAGKDLSEELKDLFKETRAKWIEDTQDVAVSHQRYRLEKLQEVVDHVRASGNKNYTLLLQSLEQAAKEKGGFFTNRRELTGKGGGPIETAAITMDQWRADAAARRAQAEEAVANFEPDAAGTPTASAAEIPGDNA